MRPMYLDKPGVAAKAHRLYDLSIADINERREKSKVLPSGQDAAEYLGIKQSHLSEMRKPGKRVYSPKHEKFFAIRLA